MPLPFPYLYDPLGTSPDNLIVNETRTVVPPTDPELANFIVPSAAPFFKTGFIMRLGPLNTDTQLVEDVHFKFRHPFVEAGNSVNQSVYGSIEFIDLGFNQTVYMTYQTLGGAYTLDDISIIENLTKSLYSLPYVTWSQIVGLPVAFPPLPHDHPANDMSGMTELITAIGLMTDAITAAGGNVPGLVASLLAHVTGPSSHTKAQVGLSNLPNYGEASEADVDNAVSNKLITAEKLAYGIAKFVPDATESVKGRIRKASVAEAVAGINSNSAVTPEGLLEALVEFAGLANSQYSGLRPVAVVRCVGSSITANLTGNVTLETYTHDTVNNFFEYELSFSSLPALLTDTGTTQNFVFTATGSRVSFGYATLVDSNTIRIQGVYESNATDAFDTTMEGTLWMMNSATGLPGISYMTEPDLINYFLERQTLSPTSGSLKLPGGLTLKYGRAYPVITDSGGHTVTFATPFDTEVLYISPPTLISGTDGTEGNALYIKNDFDRFHFRLTYVTTPNAYLIANGYFWFALGR